MRYQYTNEYRQKPNNPLPLAIVLAIIFGIGGGAVCGEAGMIGGAIGGFLLPCFIVASRDESE